MKKIFSLFLLCSIVSSLMAWDALYLIGDATSAGWNTENAISMNKISDDEFEWTGELSAGQMKILSGKSFESQSYGPAHNEFSTSSSTESFNQLVRNCVYDAETFNDGSSHAYGDYKFGVETAGWYTVHINTTSMKISTYPRYLYPVGSGCEVGWSTESEIALVETGLGTGVYCGDLVLRNNGGNELKFNCARDYSIFVGPTNDRDGEHDINGAGIYQVTFYTSNDHKFWVLDDGFGTFHFELNLTNGRLYIFENRTFEFKFDGAAATSWGNESPVGLYYWQNYAMDGEDAEDHANTILLSKNGEGVYTATVNALNNVKFVVQSDLEHGFQGDGHYTVEAAAGERSTGFNENKKFWIRDNGSGHYVELTDNFDFTPAEMHIALNKDGFASFYWDKNYELIGADAYVAKVSGEDVVLTKINGNGIIPARSAVVLYGAAGATANAVETLDAATGYDYENALRGTTTATIPAGNYYVLAEYDGETSFVKISSYEVPANRAYLPASGAGAPAHLRVRFAPEVVTEISNVNDNANVNKYIRDGRVYIVRDNKVYTVTGQCVNE